MLIGFGFVLNVGLYNDSELKNFPWLYIKKAI
jgi:hypothetical protein